LGFHVITVATLFAFWRLPLNVLSCASSDMATSHQEELWETIQKIKAVRSVRGNEQALRDVLLENIPKIKVSNGKHCHVLLCLI
jgi:hypothetical protein